MKTFVERNLPKDVNTGKYMDCVKKLMKQQREQIPAQALRKMGLPTKDGEP